MGFKTGPAIASVDIKNRGRRDPFPFSRLQNHSSSSNNQNAVFIPVPYPLWPPQRKKEQVEICTDPSHALPLKADFSVSLE